jgi:hypothetical protein
MLLWLGHPPVGLSTAARPALLGALPAGLHAHWQLRLPVAALVAGLAAAVTVEFVLPGPTVAVLGPDRVTTGMAERANYASALPLPLAPCCSPASSSGPPRRHQPG